MTWQRQAQIALGVVGLGVAVALVVMRRDRPVVTPPPSIGTIDPTSLQQGARGKTTSYGDGATLGTITHEKIRTYDDGRVQYEVAVLDWIQGEPFTMKAGAIAAKGAPRGTPDELDISGGVHIETPAGFRLDSDRATYKVGAGIVTLPGPVTFTQGRLTGRGVGAAYRREAKTLELLAEATATVTPDATGKGGLTATSSSMVLNRLEHALHLDGSVVLRVESQSFEAARASLFLTDDEQTVKRLRLLGGGRVTPVAGSTLQTPSMQGEAIDLLFHPDGRTVQRATLATNAVVSLGRDVLRAPWIDLDLAPDGTTVTRLNAKDGTRVELAATGESQARTIDARTLSATGAPTTGLTTATFDTDVKFVESRGSGRGAPPPFQGTSRSLVLALSGDLGAIDTAEFRRDVEFIDGVVKAFADAALYDAAKAHLALRLADKGLKRRPSAEDDRVRVSGDVVNVGVQTHDVHAVGNAETVTQPQPSATADPSALFDRSKAIFGSAPDIRYVSQSGRVTYTGNAQQLARVHQDKNDVKAEAITLEDTSQNLAARRRVDTTLELAGSLDGSGPAQPTAYRVTSDEADFDQAARRATFRGAPVDLRGPNEEAKGRSIEFRLVATSRTVSGFTITGDVKTLLSSGHEAIGDRLVFDASTGLYTLTGLPAKVKSPGQPGAVLCELLTGQTVELDRKKNIARSAGPGGSLGSTSQIPCSQSIRR